MNFIQELGDQFYRFAHNLKIFAISIFLLTENTAPFFKFIKWR